MNGDGDDVIMSTALFESIKKAKCEICGKEPIFFTSQYNHNKNKFEARILCEKCFKIVYPNYTLEKFCLLCESNFECLIQDNLFSKKEIRVFKKNFF